MPENFLDQVLFLLDHTLLLTCKTQLLDGNAFLYTVKDIIFIWLMLLYLVHATVR